MDVIYVKIIATSDFYFDVVFNRYNFFTGWIFTVLISFAVHELYKINENSSVIILMFTFFYFIPSTTYCSFGGGAGGFLTAAILYYVILIILQLKVPVIVLKKSKVRFSWRTISMIILLFSAVCIYIWVKYSHFRLIINPLDVYNVRRIVAKENIPSTINYFMNISGIIAALLINISLYNKKWIWVVVLLIITEMNFSYEGRKTVIFFPILLVLGYFFYSNRKKTIILPSIIMLQLIAILDAFKYKGLIASLVFRRQGVLLAQLSDFYYKFFQSHQTDLFRNGIMRRFGMQSTYNQDLAFVIGNNFQTQIVACNNGLLADAFQGFGIFGVITMPIIMIICLRLLDFITHDIDERLTVAVALYYAIIFMNSRWSTVLLTHGFLVACFAMILFPKNGECNEIY